MQRIVKRKRSETVLALVTISALIFGVTPALSMTGNQLYSRCEDRDHAVDEAYCNAYVTGVVDGANFMSAVAKRRLGMEAGETQGLGYCMPSGVEYQQITDIVTQYLRDNPARRHKLAQLLIMFSLRDAYPCE